MTIKYEVIVTDEDSNLELKSILEDELAEQLWKTVEHHAKTRLTNFLSTLDVKPIVDRVTEKIIYQVQQQAFTALKTNEVILKLESDLEENIIKTVDKLLHKHIKSIELVVKNRLKEAIIHKIGREV